MASKRSNRRNRHKSYTPRPTGKPATAPVTPPR